MTTGPKVTRYRIRRVPVSTATPSAPPSAASAAREAAPAARRPEPVAAMSHPAKGPQPGAAEGQMPGGIPATASSADDSPRSVEAGAAQPAGPAAGLRDDGFDPALFPPKTGAAPPDGATAVPRLPNLPFNPEDLEAVRNEGLSGRQLRLARRIAKRHGVETTTDHEAVLQLRLRGIDPFDRGALMSLDRAADGGTAPEAPMPGARAPNGGGAGRDRVQLPQRVRPAAPPGAPIFDEAGRAREIIKIQKDIARRRRRKLALLGLRLAFFVLLPTLIAGWYYFSAATPMYATKSEFVIQKADSLGGNSGLGGLFSGTQLATNQDSITVQSYLQSRDAMLRLETEQKFKEHFSQPRIDRLQRLPDNASNEAAYKLYQRNVKIGYDPSEGVIRMEVIAADPAASERFSKALISYAEQQVDRLTGRLREDQMKGARDSYQDAERKVSEAQAKVLRLQEQVGILDPASESSLVMGQLSTLQGQLQQKRLELNQLLDNARPSPARVDGARGDIARLETSIADLRSQLTVRSEGNESLAAATGQLRIAEADLETRQALLASAAQQMEAARIEANKQVRYLETGVRPVAPDEPTYPRGFEDTLLAFLIFAGIYLMLSLTASILREQVSS